MKKSILAILMSAVILVMSLASCSKPVANPAGVMDGQQTVSNDIIENIDFNDRELAKEYIANFSNVDKENVWFTDEILELLNTNFEEISKKYKNETLIIIGYTKFIGYGYIDMIWDNTIYSTIGAEMSISCYTINSENNYINIGDIIVVEGTFRPEEYIGGVLEQSSIIYHTSNK